MSRALEKLTCSGDQRIHRPEKAGTRRQGSHVGPHLSRPCSPCGAHRPLKSVRRVVGQRAATTRGQAQVTVTLIISSLLSSSLRSTGVFATNKLEALERTLASIAGRLRSAPSSPVR